MSGASVHTVTHGDREADADEEVLYLLVGRGQGHNHLVRTLAELAQYKLANLLLDALVDDRHVHQQSGTVGLDMWRYFFSHDLIYHEWYGKDDVWLDFCQRLRDRVGLGRRVRKIMCTRLPYCI